MFYSFCFTYSGYGKSRPAGSKAGPQSFIDSYQQKIKGLLIIQNIGRMEKKTNIKTINFKMFQIKEIFY